MIDVSGVRFLEGKEFWPPVIDREHDDGERAFQRRVLVKIIDDDLRVRVAFQLDDDPRVFIGLIANCSDVAENFLVHQLGDALHQRRAIHVVRNLGDDDLFFAAFDFLDAGLTAYFHAPAASLEILANAAHAADGATGREIRSLHVLHQLVERDVRVIDLCADPVDDLDQVVRRHIGRHADGDAGAAVNEQIWKGGRENSWLSSRLVVVRDKIDRVLLHVGHERGAQMGHARFGVTHGRGRIAFDRSEIALTIDEAFAHRPRLGHVHERWINYGFAVRVIVTAGVTADLRAFTMLSPGKEREIVHRVEDSPLRWLEPVARVRQSPGNNHRHRVIEERPRYLFGNIDRLYLFVRVIHRAKMTNDE